MEQSSDPLEVLAGTLNLPSELVKTVIIMLLNIPLSLVFRYINKPALRYGYSLILGLLLTFYLLHEWALYVLASALVPYILFRLIGKY